MPNPFRPILNASGYPALGPGCKPVNADENGEASCVCQPCEYYYAATICAVGTCAVAYTIYVCGTAVCNNTGEPLANNTVITNGNYCFRVSTAVAYYPEPFPVPPGGQRLPTNAITVSEFACVEGGCSDPACTPLIGYYQLKPCSCNPSPSNIPCLVISCDCYVQWKAVYACPVWSYPNPAGGVYCFEVDASLPAIPGSPSGGPPPGCQDICSTPVDGCCRCCTGCYSESRCDTRVTYSGTTVNATGSPKTCCCKAAAVGSVSSGTGTFTRTLYVNGTACVFLKYVGTISWGPGGVDWDLVLETHSDPYGCGPVTSTDHSSGHEDIGGFCYAFQAAQYLANLVGATGLLISPIQLIPPTPTPPNPNPPCTPVQWGPATGSPPFTTYEGAQSTSCTTSSGNCTQHAADPANELSYKHEWSVTLSPAAGNCAGGCDSGGPTPLQTIPPGQGDGAGCGGCGEAWVTAAPPEDL